MNKLTWHTTVRKTAWASGKKKLSKRALGELMAGVSAMEDFMAQNKSNFGDIDRREKRKLTYRN